MRFVFVAVLVLAGVPAFAAAPPADGASAKALVDWIYRDVVSGKVDFNRVRFAPELARLIAIDAQNSRDEVGLIDAIPFCECQDTDPEYRFTSTLASARPGGATVAVMLTNGRTTRYRIDLVMTPRGWAVADIHSVTTPSFVAYLRRGLIKRPR